LTLAARARITISASQVPGLEATAFSTEIASDLLVVADRTMTWDATHYGSHAETGVWPSGTWYFAEGATHGPFDLFYLVQNPASTPARVDVTYLLPSGEPIRRSYSVGAQSRFTIWVDREDPLLAAAEVSAVFVSDLPIVVERAMYLTRDGRLFLAGHDSAGVPSPGTQWFLAEGATGEFFDLFVLVANAETRAADVRVTYLLPDGNTIVRTLQISPQSRTTIWVDLEDPLLAVASAVSTIVESTNGTPILVERAMWWPGTPANWHEAHTAAGTTATAARWALAEGETGGSDATATYVLVSNVSPSPGTFDVTLLFEDGTSSVRTFSIPASARSTLDIGVDFPESADKRYGVLVESRADAPLDLVVDRAMYSTTGGVTWAAGTAAAGTPLPFAGTATGSAALPVVTLGTARHAAEAGPVSGAFIVRRTDGAGPLTVHY
jgi:hypothetical protein